MAPLHYTHEDTGTYVRCRTIIALFFDGVILALPQCRKATIRAREEFSSDPASTERAALADSTERAALADRISEVPDMLIAAQLYLRPLANGETYEIPPDARRIIGHACALLDSALENVLDVTGNLIDDSPANTRRRSSDGTAKVDDDSSGA